MMAVSSYITGKRPTNQEQEQQAGAGRSPNYFADLPARAGCSCFLIVGRFAPVRTDRYHDACSKETSQRGVI